MNFGELYLALKQNVVDGQENPLPTIKSGKFDEVQKYLVLTGHIITPRLVVVNEAFWQKLKPEDRKIDRGRGRSRHRAGRTPSSSRPEKTPGRQVQGGRHDRDHAGRRELPQAR